MPFDQRISRTNFKICFSRSCLPSRVTKQTYFGNFTCLQSHFGSLKPWGKCYVTPLRKPSDDCFCIFYSSFFIDFCHPTNRNQVFSILEHVLSQLSKVTNVNFAFGKLHFLTIPSYCCMGPHILFFETSHEN